LGYGPTFFGMSVYTYVSNPSDLGMRLYVFTYLGIYRFTVIPLIFDWP
jgi:hypothetical protein